jgi:hypothetical protein
VIDGPDPDEGRSGRQVSASAEGVPAGVDAQGAGSGAVQAEILKADSPPRPTDKLDADRRKVGVDRARADLKLSKVVGYGALGLMAGQVLIADTAFFLYGFGNDWNVPAAAMDAWLTAAVIQVIGVVLVITRYLFPGSGGDAI